MPIRRHLLVPALALMLLPPLAVAQIVAPAVAPTAAAATLASSPASAPAHRRTSSPADLQAITQLTLDFRRALATHDAPLLASLLLHDRILFASPRPPAAVRRQREAGDAQADGIPADGARAFLQFVGSGTRPIEERFHDVRIVQDGHVAWVTFDFDFLEDGRIGNQGVEVWQVVRTADEAWRILSVVWTSHGAPPAH